MDIEVGQVLALKIRFNNEPSRNISRKVHPYLVVGCHEDFIEIAQLDSLEGKEYKASFRSNKVVYCEDPHETVIDKDSFIQMDNKFTVENYPELTRYRRQKDTLSSDKLTDVLKSYREYQENHHIDENKMVYMDKTELEALNS